MTPMQRKFDLDLAASMMKMAKWIEPRSRKVSDTLRVAADRIRMHVSSAPVDPAPHDKKTQPASAPSKHRR